MSEYALTVFAICLATGALLMLTYGQGRAESLAVGIISLSVILTPLADMIFSAEPEDFLNSLKGESVEGEFGADGVIEDAFAEGIVHAVSDKFSLERANVRVRLVDFDAKNMRAEKIVLTLSGSAAVADYKAVEKYVNSLDLGVCNVQIEIG
ncbi:MAG: hypothetical protein J6V80_00925 [Clostridia bacterium]|nr:hypothetical protein [Clostridia bacterium]